MKNDLCKSIEHYNDLIVSYEGMKSTYKGLCDTYERRLLERERERLIERLVWIPLGLKGKQPYHDCRDESERPCQCVEAVPGR